MPTAGRRFRERVAHEAPLAILGTINAYSALLAMHAGARAIYLSGAGVANASYGLPDLGMTGLSEVLEDARRITSICDLPLLVDIDTGFGHAFNIARSISMMQKAGVAAVHIEDQVSAKRCGHRPNKALVTVAEMCDRIKAATDGRQGDDFVIMARTDAYTGEGLTAAIERAQSYVAVGADMIFVEAMTSLDEYQRFTQAVSVPVLANITEFGKTPLFLKEALASVGIAMVLYPLSAFRAMSKAALAVYQAILTEGSQASVLSQMQTREELYEQLNYHHYEAILDKLRERDHGE